MENFLPSGVAAMWPHTNLLSPRVVPLASTLPSSPATLIDNVIRYSTIHPSWQLNQWWTQSLLHHLGQQYALQQALKRAPLWNVSAPCEEVVDVDVDETAPNTPDRSGERQTVIQLVENGSVMPVCAEPKISLAQLLPNSPISNGVEEAYLNHLLLHPSPSSSITSGRSRGQPGDSKGTGGSTTNRLSYTREFKLMVIDYFLANGQNKYRTCKKFHITKSMLNSWLQKEPKIRASKPGSLKVSDAGDYQPSRSASSLKSGRSGRRPQFPIIEKRLFELYSREMQIGNRKINNKWLRDAARSMAHADEEQSTDGATEEGEPLLATTCQFSERWLSNFKKRWIITPSDTPKSTTPYRIGADSGAQ